MSEEGHDSFAAWLAGRPESVQKLAAEFPPGQRFDIAGKIYYVLGWTEDDTLILTDVDPAKDYDGAQASKFYFCAAHARPVPEAPPPPAQD